MWSNKQKISYLGRTRSPRSYLRAGVGKGSHTPFFTPARSTSLNFSRNFWPWDSFKWIWIRTSNNLNQKPIIKTCTSNHHGLSSCKTSKGTITEKLGMKQQHKKQKVSQQNRIQGFTKGPKDIPLSMSEALNKIEIFFKTLSVTRIVMGDDTS